MLDEILSSPWPQCGQTCTEKGPSLRICGPYFSATLQRSKSMPTDMKGGQDSRRSFGKSALFCCSILPLSFQHVTQLFKMVEMCRFPAPAGRYRPRWWIGSWWCFISRRARWHNLGMTTGCLSFPDNLALRMRPPTLMGQESMQCCFSEEVYRISNMEFPFGRLFSALLSK